MKKQSDRSLPAPIPLYLLSQSTYLYSRIEKKGMWKKPIFK